MHRLHVSAFVDPKTVSCVVLFCSRPTHDLRFHAGMNRRWKLRLTSHWLCLKTA